MQELARHELVHSQRGLGGGFTLARLPADISVYDVVQAVDPINPIKRIHQYPLGKSEHAGNLCPLHRRLDEAAAAVEQSFRCSKILEMVASPVFSRDSP
jgi:Rrf2 family transcriptional regulator, nitric oxide-sensitive transcriptional repressor